MLRLVTCALIATALFIHSPAASGQPEVKPAPKKEPAPEAAAGGLVLTIVMGALGLAFYMLPSIIAVLRGHPNVGPILVVNIFLGWICLGWIVALAWCFSAGPSSQTVYINNRRRRSRDDDYDD